MKPLWAKIEWLTANHKYSTKVVDERLYVWYWNFKKQRYIVHIFYGNPTFRVLRERLRYPWSVF